GGVPGIRPAVPDRPLRFAGFRDRHRPARHGRGRRDALISFQPRRGVRGRDRRRRHPYALSRRPRPCRVERRPACERPRCGGRFEDVHWIDPTSLELLTVTVDRVPQLRVLLLLTAPPEFTPPWPHYAHVTTV